ncbi:hypothetical protein ASF43_11515 [Pseudorhodoferax sp. Leaf267]|nr:hypothetical protein ASF43_11515 [Pseudorhodoferax sp. Leaf267]
MRTTSKFILALSTALAMVAPGAQAAGNMAGQLNAKMVLQSGCIVSGAPGAGTSGVNFGTLDFGSQPATFTGVLLATASGGVGGAGATEITCSPDVTSLSVSVSAGNNAGQGGAVGTGARAMKLGTSTYLPYDVYSDSNLATPYPTSANAVSVVLPGTGASFPLPIFAKVNKTSPAALTAGTYTDVLQVTLPGKPTIRLFGRASLRRVLPAAHLRQGEQDQPGCADGWHLHRRAASHAGLVSPPHAYLGGHRSKTA